MIAYLKGEVVSAEPTRVLMEVSGIGYEAKISLNTYTQIKEERTFKLITHHYIREGVQVLYGFASEGEMRMFLHLIGISGVGPNSALMVLSSMSVDEVAQAIVAENVKSIQAVKGIGAKTASRIVLELKDKLRKEGFEGQGAVLQAQVQHFAVKEEALEALTVLGIARSAAEKSIDSILKKNGAVVSTEELIKLVLKAK
ncbi:MAG: Holliday junction branch migration protein RuvA [Cytophagales bacterium]|nr:Holliday junction branch migration protein RuvA [Cytophagales bacterium]